MKLDIGKPFGNALKKARRRALLSQEELALKAHLDRSYISLLERGHRKPSMEAVMLLAMALEIDTLVFVDEILNHCNAANSTYEANASGVTDEHGQVVRSVERRKNFL